MSHSTVLPDGDEVFDVEGQATLVQDSRGAIKEVRSSEVKRFRFWRDGSGTWALEFVTLNGAAMTVCVRPAKPKTPKLDVWVQSEKSAAPPLPEGGPRA